DEALRARLQAIDAPERQSALAAVVKLAAEAGFVFTAQSYDEALRGELAHQHSAEELDEQLLNQVAGGGFTLAQCNRTNTVVPPPTKG
ncbi:MAG: hypothetical protein AB7K24_27725, partial [Gemmataceae bacterium]